MMSAINECGAVEMKTFWLLRIVTAVGLLALLVGGVACGGGGKSDEEKIRARLTGFVDHVNKADAKGAINDLHPDLRKDCDEQEVKAELERTREQQGTLRDVTVKSIEGDRATVNVTIAVRQPGQPEQTASSDLTLRRSGKDWYID